MTGRTWEVGDQAAIRDHVDQPWQLAALVEISPSSRLVLRGKGVPDLIRDPDDARVIPADEVPPDERHWLSQDERDQLVRQEAAGRLRATAAALDHDPGLLELATLMDDLVGPDGGGWLHTGSWVSTADLIRAARALLNPAPPPATTPPLTFNRRTTT